MKNKFFWVLLACLWLLVACQTEQKQKKNKSSEPTASLQTEGDDAPTRDYSLAAPEGNDILSSSTNHRQNAEDLRIQPNGLLGAVSIPPPSPNHYGTLTTSYPLEIPTGRAGMQPALALGYSSSSSDGWMGIGWSVGVPGIGRNTEHGPLAYDRTDEFTYNGQRLVKVSGSSLNENGVYRLEIESDFDRLELVNIEQGGIWTVFHSDGSKSIFGQDLSSRIYHPDNHYHTYRWNLSRKEDRNSNFLEVEYNTSFYDENHILYLKEIRYTGNTSQSVNARQYVRFHLKPRDDFYVSKAAGFIIKMDRLLDFIEVGFDNQELWRYTMVYETSPDSGRPLLKTVETDRTTTQPFFHYQDAEHTLGWQKINNFAVNDSELDNEQTQYFEGDYNGDALSDMVFFNPQTGDWKSAEGSRDGGYVFKTYANRFKGYQTPEDIQWFPGNASGDYNGDARSDIPFYLPKSQAFWVAEHDGEVFQFRNYGQFSTKLGTLQKEATEWFMGDFDGNGLSDILLFHEPDGAWWYLQNTGGQFELRQVAKRFQHLFRSDYTTNATTTQDGSAQGHARNSIHFLAGDYNADGRMDLSFYDRRNGQWWVGATFPDENQGFRLQWTLYKIFDAPEQALFTYDRFSGDYNGDGFSDFLLFDRAEGQWILGATGDHSIDFRLLSKTPQFKEITRWLQGDYNGDGRTDIGFYSETDQNFWIGEGTQEGFRYRIYSNLANGPDPQRVMATPLPKDQVNLQLVRTVLSGDTDSTLVDYAYDDNPDSDRGEQAFLGCFFGKSNGTCTQPQLLIFDKADQKWNLKSGEALTKGVLTLDIQADHRQLWQQGKVQSYQDSTKDELLYYQKNIGSFISHEFRVIQHSANTNLVANNFVEFEDHLLTQFDISQSVVLVDQFETNRTSVLIFDDLANSPRFLLIGSSNTTLQLKGTYPVSLDNQPFTNGSGNNRELRSHYRFFSGDFLNQGSAQVLLLDQSDANHQWYLGTLDLIGEQINFVQLSSSVLFDEAPFDSTFNAAGIDYQVQTDGHLVYASVLYGSAGEPNTPILHRLQITATSLNETKSHALSINQQEVVFLERLDHQNQPLLQTEDHKLYTYSWDNAQLALWQNGTLSYTLDRADLLTNVYPFRWIQGDYNGDNKTDIGIFHLKEPTWYYAVTTGTVPDLMEKIENGIGGAYTFEYTNSSQFDNTGDDSISDLPFNYKVFSAVTLNDGQNFRKRTTYQYRHGHTFSQFIDGKKEVDYFGFGELTVTNAYNAKTINTYHNSPHNNYLKNRALSGALKESRVLGENGEEFKKTDYSYQIHTIQENDAQTRVSYFREPSKIATFTKGIPVKTATSQATFQDNAYFIESITSSTTDHYQDAVHSESTITNQTLYEWIPETNHQRAITKTNSKDSTHETKTSFVFDSQGNLTQETTSYTGTGLAAVANHVVAYEYDGYGNLTASEDQSATPFRRSETAYDSVLHQFITEEKNFTDDSTLSTQHVINYDNAFGAATQTIDPNNNKTYFDYDSYGRVEQVRADTEIGVKTLRTYAFDHTFPLSGKVWQYGGSQGDDMITRTFYDGLGRTIHTVKSAPNDKFIKSGLVVYDSVGRVIRTSQPSFVESAEIDAFYANASDKHATTFYYDPFGRKEKTILPQAFSGEAETSISMTYNDPWESTTVNSWGKGKTTRNDARGHVLYVTDFGKGDDGIYREAKLAFCYDLHGNLSKKMDLMAEDLPEISMNCDMAGAAIKDTSGYNAAYWQYDGFGQTVLISDPDQGVTQKGYNAFGDLSQKTDALGQTTTYAYDRLGRLTQKTLPNSEGTVAYTYDFLAGSNHPKGRLVAIDDPASYKSMSYDSLGRVIEETRYVKNPSRPLLDTSYVTQFRYNLHGQPTEIDYPADPLTGKQIRVCNTYGDSQVQQIDLNIKSSSTGCVQDNKNIISNIDYNEFGQMDAIHYSNGLVTQYTYDHKRRLKNTRSTKGSAVIQDVDYTFNLNDSIAQLDNNADGHETHYSYQYDGLDRLVDAQGSYNNHTDPLKKYHRQYAYAANGNLLSKKFLNTETGAINSQWTYSYQNHAVTTIQTSDTGSDLWQMSYDAVGNMTQQSNLQTSQQKQLVFDSRNRITSATNPQTSDVVGQYWYDDEGFRVKKISKYDTGSGIKETELVYPSMYFGIENGDPNDDEKWNIINNVYLDGIRVAASVPSGETLFYLGDQVDSLKVIVDDTGAVVSRHEYLPYGESWEDVSSTNHAPKFNAQEFDKETKFYFYNARYYDPVIARFVTADHMIDGIYDTQGWNRYSYVKGNPIRYSDPSGKWVMALVDGLVAAAEHALTCEGDDCGIGKTVWAGVKGAAISAITGGFGGTTARIIGKPILKKGVSYAEAATRRLFNYLFKSSTEFAASEGVKEVANELETSYTGTPKTDNLSLSEKVLDKGVSDTVSYAVEETPSEEAQKIGKDKKSQNKGKAKKKFLKVVINQSYKAAKREEKEPSPQEEHKKTVERKINQSCLYDCETRADGKAYVECVNAGQCKQGQYAWKLGRLYNKITGVLFASELEEKQEEEEK